MSNQNNIELIKKHLDEVESVEIMALGGVYRLYVTFLAWTPLWIMVVLRVFFRAVFGALWWIMAVVIAVIIMNIFATKRYLIAVTKESLHMIGVKRYKLVETSHFTWRLNEVSATKLKEGKRGANFRLHTQINDWDLGFADGESARAIYERIRKGAGTSS